ncbi:unnamed protein product [Linum trigynum]|uniref:Uncharacterized protein n=1 Tax=Linum trigynum TaxID=586398 RepID=A0AAV2CHX7_9ROSI
MRSNNLSKTEMFVYTEPVVGVGGHSGHGQTSGIHGGRELLAIIPTKVTMILIHIFSTKSKVKVIINISRHTKKKFNRTSPTNLSITSTQAAVVFTTTIMELMKVPFMSWIRWRMPC